MNKTQKKILIASFILAIMYKLGAVKKMGNLARGLRNNNPMNIRKTDIDWDGKTTGSDESFETFIDPVYGIRAGAKLLINYQDRYNLNTVNDIIGRFAPPSENNTNSYAEHVASAIGVDVNQPINVQDHLHTMIKTMIKHENGVNPYSDNLISNGIAMV